MQNVLTRLWFVENRDMDGDVCQIMNLCCKVVIRHVADTERGHARSLRSETKLGRNKGQNRMKKLMLVAIAAALAGCVSVNKNDGGNEIVQPEIFSKDAVQLSYELNQTPVTATENIKWINLGFISFSWGGTADHWSDFAPSGVKLPFFGPSLVDVAKNGAYAKACAAAGTDSVVATRYSIESTSYVVYGTVKADIKGLPAKVTKVELVDANKMPPKKAQPLF